MECENALKLLKYFNRILDCTYPPDDLAKALGINKVLVDVAISNFNNGVIEFQFEVSDMPDEPLYKYLDTNSDILKKYIGIAIA